MPLWLVVFLPFVVIYTVLSFWLALQASKVLAIVQGTDPSDRLAARAKLPARWGRSGPRELYPGSGYSALTPSLWRAIVRSTDLPEQAEPIQQRMKIPYLASQGILYLGGAAMLVAAAASFFTAHGNT